jgi:hypothetical protein
MTEQGKAWVVTRWDSGSGDRLSIRRGINMKEPAQGEADSVSCCPDVGADGPLTQGSKASGGFHRLTVSNISLLRCSALGQEPFVWRTWQRLQVVANAYRGGALRRAVLSHNATNEDVSDSVGKRLHLYPIWSIQHSGGSA